MPRLTTTQRSEAIGMMRANAKVSDVAKFFGVTRMAIHLLKKRHLATASTNDGRRSGRPKITTPIQKNGQDGEINNIRLELPKKNTIPIRRRSHPS